MLATALLLGLVLVASITDLLRHKIYNWNTYGGIAAALALSATGTAWIAQNDAARDRAERLLGAVSLADCVGGLLVCGITMIVCLVFFGKIGGGDVKLLAMMGAFLGTNKGLEALLWTFVFGACMGMIGLVWQVGPLKMVSRVVRLLFNAVPRWLCPIRLTWLPPLNEVERQSMQPPVFLAPAGLAATIIVKFSLIT